MNVCKMRLKGLTAALIGLSALCWTSCGSTRQATESSSERVSSIRFQDSRDSSAVEKIEVLDTLKEVTTITIDRNDKGDTLKVVQITDRTRASSRDNVVAQKVKTEVRVDTVYVEKRDSVFVQETLSLDRLGTGSAQGDKASPVTSALKWIFWIIIGLIALIITVKLCLHR